ncbi:FG-GAP repeat domain-containing protein [Fimbriiglobus ruber]|uniref:VCBS repeat-containing protein n=1 Tax=Fimbriiglobus ruber TaxID=1908690 RepID=A0A225DTP6_9BACT|nr:VCBS repeat-containing protein [Fimbriiglobus ruber]OWK39755.1 hypothetical protein FRUB_05645 [Fimbriiglobus ruber]
MSIAPPRTRYRLWTAGLVGLVALAAAAGAVGYLRWAPGAGTPPPARPAPLPAADIEVRVHNFCGGSCHAYPPPDTFPRRYWRAEVERGFRFFEQSGLSLPAPPVESVVRYFEDRAPEELPAAECPAAGRPLGVRFERVSYPGPAAPVRPAVSNVNLVRLSAPTTGAGPLEVLACDMQGGRVMLLRPADPAPAWKVLARVANPAHAEVVDLDGDGIRDILVANLGSFPPTDRRCGSVVWLRGRADGSFTPITLLDNVGRVADVRAADFFGTGKLDLVVGVFGLHAAGEILLLENLTENWDKPRFVPRTLDARPGAIHVPVADLNGDGKPDFVALIAQEHETVVAFINEGGGSFRKQTLYRAPHPGYGSSGIQLVDLNGDGSLDVLYTNGDILDEPYLYKPYHGVQWLENKGGLLFEHHPIAPMYGAHNAVAADLTGTGRLDIVAVSFLPGDKFPDRPARKADAVVVLEQVAPGRFERHPLLTAECDAVVCAAGDLYGTGRADIVVGNFSSMTTDHPVTIWKNLGGPAAGSPRQRPAR